ncbi:MAG: hypothetical protein KDC49_11150 [Saprospiraceae bacterium]|nr:hypothetical protein [Saprospiraceae bacterium]
MKFLKVILVMSVLFVGLIHSSIAQTWDGIYSDGNVVLVLEEQGETIKGLFIAADKTEYPIKFIYMERGIAGVMGAYNAFIPYNTENLKFNVTPFDKNNKAIWDKTYTYELEYVTDLEGNAPEEVVYEYSWNPIHRFGTDFYPSYVLATSTMTNETIYEPEDQAYSFYGDLNGYFGVSINGLEVGTNVSVVIEGQPFIRPSEYNVTISQSGVSEIYPVIEYDFNALKGIDQAQPINLKYIVYIDGEYEGEQLEIVWARNVNDAVTWGLDHHGNNYKMDFIFAAYVNENEPNLDPILGAILDEGIVESWIGYQGSADDVFQQVFALWYHFQKKGFRYSSITTQSGSDEKSAGQVVRFIKDALVTSQANCIDGTVLFASFLYKIGIDVSIVLVPGHAYLAFSGDQQGTTKYALETTMMGQLNLKRAPTQNALYQSLGKQDNEIEQSWNSFLGAMNTGTENYYSQALPGIQKQDPFYLEINIADARRQKIRPIK